MLLMRHAPGRRAALAGVALGAALLLAFLGLRGSAADADAKGKFIELKRAAVQRLLRLGDVGPGHSFLVIPEEGSDRRIPKILCGKVGPADQQKKLKAFLDDRFLIGCFATYVRVFPLGDSPAYHVVGTGAIDTRNPTIAMGGLAVSPLLLSHMFNDEIPQEVPAPETVGDETRLFHIADFPIFGDEHPEASLLAWRSGGVLAAVFVQGGDAATDDREAVELARTQQQRIENPTPYSPAERYDHEAGLEDPAIKMPIYWLGRVLHPGGSLPPARLIGGGAVGTLVDGLPGQKLGLYYGQGLRLTSWTAAGWERFSQTRLGSQMIGWDCTKARKVALPEGSATLYAAYAKDFKTCPHKAPPRHFAVAEAGGVVTAVNFLSCGECNPIDYGTAYNSTVGMKAVVKALKPWSPSS
jgi:hypothetical protein